MWYSFALIGALLNVYTLASSLGQSTQSRLIGCFWIFELAASDADLWINIYVYIFAIFIYILLINFIYKYIFDDV